MAAKVLIEVPAHLETATRQFLAFSQEMEQLALAAPEGQVLKTCKEAVLHQGRAILNQTLTQAVVRRIETTEKKGPRSATVPAAARSRTAAPNPAG
jgi:hypothetical protein